MAAIANTSLAVRKVNFMNGIIEKRAGVEFAAGIEKADLETQEKRMTSLGCPADVLTRIREKRAARTATPRVRITPLPSEAADKAADAARRKKAEELGRQILADDVKTRLTEM
jgi:hypothetical protein